MSTHLDIKVIAAQTFTELLDEIPVRTEADFPIIAKALEALNARQPTGELPPSLQDRFRILSSILDNVDNIPSCANLKTVIQKCIAQKVDQFRHLTSAEKHLYIAVQELQSNNCSEIQLLLRTQEISVISARLVKDYNQRLQRELKDEVHATLDPLREVNFPISVPNSLYEQNKREMQKQIDDYFRKASHANGTDIIQ